MKSWNPAAARNIRDVPPYAVLSQPFAYIYHYDLETIKIQPEVHFLRDFTIIWLSVELAGRAKI